MLSALDAFPPQLRFCAFAPIIYLFAVALGRLLKRRLGVRLGIVYQLFCVALTLWAPLRLYDKLAGFGEGWEWLGDLSMHLGAAVALLGTLVLLALVRRFFWEMWFERTQKTVAPKFISELASLFIFAAALLLVTKVIYQKPIAQFALGSTVVAAILGFALQDLLGNIIAGISLEIGKPFRTGDWLDIDKQHAEVIEVNWRSTRLRTNDDIYLDVPNKLIVSSKITNLTFPTRAHALRLLVGFEYGAAPNLVKDCLVRAAANATGVLDVPPPQAYLKEFGDSAIIYEIKFTIDDESKYNSIMDGIKTNIWYEAQRNRLRIPYPIRTIQIDRRRQQQPEDESIEAARASVRRQPFFQMLEEDQLTRILRAARIIRFGRGEKVIEQGAEGYSMFFLLEGHADVYVHANGYDARVATLKAGDYCGEMSLLTGEPRSATVVARSDCEMCEIEKNILGNVLQENEPLVRKLGELLAQRQMENEGVLASSASNAQRDMRKQEYTEGFLRRLYSFFEL